MTSGSGDPNSEHLIGFWDFLKGSERADTGLADGIAQNGNAFGDAAFRDGKLVLDGHKDYFTTSGDDRPFDIDEATIVVRFSQGSQPHQSADILLNRGEWNDRMKDGYLAIGVTGDGRIELTHMSDCAELNLRTNAHLFRPGDDVVVSYAFSASKGGVLTVENLTTGANQTIDFDTKGLSLATHDEDGENFTFGAREVREGPNNNTKFFDGKIDSVAVYNKDILTAPTSDGIVSGTAGDDLIDLAYTGDPDGDRIDAGDANLPGQAPDDDIVEAGDGDDRVFSGVGDDTVLAEDGDDFVDGGSGDDTIFGGDGDDTLRGGTGDDFISGGNGDDAIFGDEGHDVLRGGAGDDTIDGGRGNDDINGGTGNDTLLGGEGGCDTLNGGDDRDTFKNVGVFDHVIGGEGGDDFDTLDLTGSAGDGTLEVFYTSPDREDGFVKYFDANGHFTGKLVFEEIENVVGVPCFTPGTLIATPQGVRPVEQLRAGDRVITRDNGLQEICWHGARGLTGAELTRNPHFRPIRIAKGALGNGLPEKDMLVSPNHRMLVANDKTSLYFEEHEVLVAAKHLTALPGIEAVDVPWITYIHLMFEQHEVILSDGAWTESFQPGDESLRGIGNAQRLEIMELFPELGTASGLGSYQAARRSLKRYEARLLAL